jgi:flagellar basal-body rod modification protein FlgD
MRLEQISTSTQGLDTQAAAPAAAPKDEFLRLLVAQLQHQDPLSPQDSAAFVAQLAQFTAVEQSAETNSRLASLEASFASNERAGYAQLVGKTVTAKTSTINVPVDGCTLLAHVEGTAAGGEVIIRDSNGTAVKKIALDPMNKGDHEIAWDGTSDKGNPVADGEYTIEVTAKSSTGGPVQAYAQIQGVVTALTFENGGVQFRIGSESINPGEIVSVGTSAFDAAQLQKPQGAHPLATILKGYNNVDLVNSLHGL